MVAKQTRVINQYGQKLPFIFKTLHLGTWRTQVEHICVHHAANRMQIFPPPTKGVQSCAFFSPSSVAFFLSQFKFFRKSRRWRGGRQLRIKPRKPGQPFLISTTLSPKDFQALWPLWQTQRDVFKNETVGLDARTQHHSDLVYPPVICTSLCD